MRKDVCAFLYPRKDSLVLKEGDENYVCKLGEALGKEGCTCIAIDAEKIGSYSSLQYNSRRASICRGMTTDSRLAQKVIVGLGLSDSLIKLTI